MRKARKKSPKWGSELPDDPPPIDRPIATASGFDLSADVGEQVKARANCGDPVLAEPLTTPYRRWHAIHYGATAAAMLGLLNLAALLYGGERPSNALIGTDLRSYFAAQLVAAALAGSLAFIITWKRSLMACRIVMIWSVVELFPWIPNYFYGHVETWRMWALAASAAACAYVGLRGAWAEQDAEAKSRVATHASKTSKR